MSVARRQLTGITCQKSVFNRNIQCDNKKVNNKDNRSI